MAPIFGGVGFQVDGPQDIGGYQMANIDDFTPTENLPTNWYTTKTPLSGIPAGTMFTGDEADRVRAFEAGQAMALAEGIETPPMAETIAETYVEFIDNTVSNIGNVTEQAGAAALGATTEVIQTAGQTTEGIIESTAAPIGAAFENIAPIALVLGLAFIATR
tara:strand:+ start:62 stop:547 length:486 start_codon:yes stop_codon:yes gene_type:complete